MQKAFFAAAVVAFAAVLKGVNAFGLHQARNAVGELDLSAYAARLLANLIKHRRGEYVAAGHAHARRRYFRRRLFHHARDLDQPGLHGVSGHDAVTARVLGGHFLHGDHRLLERFKLRHHLRHDGWCAHHQIVGQQHGKGFVAHQVFGAQHRVAQAQ